MLTNHKNRLAENITEQHSVLKTMKTTVVILLLISLISCESNLFKAQSACHGDYLKGFQGLGNTVQNAYKSDKKYIDPIDDTISFKKAAHDFFTKDNKVFKRSKTHIPCDKRSIEIQYYQDVSKKIDLESFKVINSRFFSSKGKVWFWWVNSGGHVMVPVENADPETFQPFDEICGGADAHGVYYGCPNRGVYQLNIAPDADYLFVEKEDNYWNSPSHFVLIDGEVYDSYYEYKKGYLCEQNDSFSLNKLLTIHP